MENEEMITTEGTVQEAPAVPKKHGRRPRTEEQKKAAAKAREERKRKAENLVPEVYVQFQETQAKVSDLIERAKAEFRKEKKRTSITELKLYVKPDERTAYYVINEKAEGKVEY